jgi:hypothetical protein
VTDTDTRKGLIYDTREAWLTAAVNAIRPRFEALGHEVPAFRVSVGFPKGVASEVAGVIYGVTYNRHYVADGAYEVFISPEDADTVNMILTVWHEMIHVTAGLDCGHKGEFVTLARAFGMMSPYTETPAGIELAADLLTLCAALGPYPGSFMTLPTRRRKADPVITTTVTPTVKPGRVSSGPAKQTNRNIICRCVDCGWTFRATRMWIARGLPTCVCGGKFTETGPQ